jgi:hypothetical protein
MRPHFSHCVIWSALTVGTLAEFFYAGMLFGRQLYFMTLQAGSHIADKELGRFLNF